MVTTTDIFMSFIFAVFVTIMLFLYMLYETFKEDIIHY